MADPSAPSTNRDRLQRDERRCRECRCCPPSTIRKNGRDRRCDAANVDRLSICSEVFRERGNGWFRQRVTNRQPRKTRFLIVNQKARFSFILWNVCDTLRASSVLFF